MITVGKLRVHVVSLSFVVVILVHVVRPVPGYDVPTSLANLAATTSSLLISTASTSFCHVVISYTVENQPCNWATTFGASA